MLRFYEDILNVRLLYTLFALLGMVSSCSTDEMGDVCFGVVENIHDNISVLSVYNVDIENTNARLGKNWFIDSRKKIMACAMSSWKTDQILKFNADKLISNLVALEALFELRNADMMSDDEYQKNDYAKIKHLPYDDQVLLSRLFFKEHIDNILVSTETIKRLLSNG